MTTLKQEYWDFLHENFNGLKLKQALFYSWNYGLRFDLQTGMAGTNEYFIEVVRRASTLFQTVFENRDELFFLFMDYKYRHRKIRFGNYAFKQIRNINKDEICYTKTIQRYNPNVIYNIALIKLTTDRINYKNVFAAIGNADFPSRQPRLDENGMFTDKEIYFININKKLIFHMYDDRGLDIIATDKETLRPIYEKHNEWILDYDREKIDDIFRLT
jgi:hypothetical protein